MSSFIRILILAIASLISFSALAADKAAPYEIILKEHRFSPEALHVPANTKFSIIIHNQDASAEEFESHELKREKIIPANGKITVRLGPLKPGTYHYFGEYNEATAKGTIIAE